MDPGVLAQVLRPLQDQFSTEAHPEVLVGLGVADDAAVYRLNEQQAIISTTDFFTPVVDDPYDYGAIAAANAMSDVYAMGGEVLFALNIAAFPPDLDPAYVTEILRGGADKVIEAGGVIAGGHTIQDKEPKYGLAVTGLVHPDHIFTKGGARPGDQLILSKPLGTGTISTALKRDLAHPAHTSAMIESMKRLNRCAARAGQAAGVRAATDITGFGLLGHAAEMTLAGNVRFRFRMGSIPLLPGATGYAAEWIFPGGSHNNKAHYAHMVEFEASIPEDRQMLLWDAQTSGGLLLAVPPERVEAFFAECAEHQQSAWVVGHVLEGEGIEVVP
ncbi:MAG: selenide, water dikinase SelD [Anaerolineae bacterium]